MALARAVGAPLPSPFGLRPSAPPQQKVSTMSPVQNVHDVPVLTGTRADAWAFVFNPTTGVEKVSTQHA